MGAFNYHMHEIQPRGRLDSDIKGIEVTKTKEKNKVVKKWRRN